MFLLLAAINEVRSQVVGGMHSRKGKKKNQECTVIVLCCPLVIGSSETDVNAELFDLHVLLLSWDVETFSSARASV